MSAASYPTGGERQPGERTSTTMGTGEMGSDIMESACASNPRGGGLGPNISGGPRVAGGPGV